MFLESISTNQHLIIPVTPKLRRIIQPSEAVFPGPRFRFTSFTHFTIERMLSGERCRRDITLALLRAPNGHTVKVSNRLIENFPGIITTVREHGHYDVCTTLDVDLTLPWREDSIGVRDPRTRQSFYLPADIVAPAAFHTEELAVRAVAV